MYAAARPMAYPRPYQPIVNGPSWIRTGFGVKSNIAGSVAGSSAGLLRSRPAGLPILATVNAEFNWWLLIVGLVVGAGLVWLVVLDSRRRDADVDESEMAREALWLSTLLADDGIDVSPATAGRMLELHRAYLEAPPPDDPEGVRVIGDAAAEPFDWPDATQDLPMSTGGGSIADAPTSTSDTPNAAGEVSPSIGGESPTQ